jgi:hypothetical protein
LPQLSDVTVEVFDILGKLVSRQELAMQGPGESSATINAERLSSGVYTYRVRVRGHNSDIERASFTGKMTLVK